LLLQTTPILKRRTFIRMWMLSILTIAVLVTIAGYYSGQFLPHYDAQVTRFFTCKGPPTISTVSVQPVRNFATTSQAIYACGLLEGTTFRRFAFYWYRDNISIYNTLDERIDLGFFYILLPNNPHQPKYYPGNYRVDIYAGRVKVMSTEFTVK